MTIGQLRKRLKKYDKATRIYMHQYLMVDVKGNVKLAFK